MIVRVIDCKRVPSPPARITAQCSRRLVLRLCRPSTVGFFEKVCRFSDVFMITGFLFADSVNIHESDLQAIPYNLLAALLEEFRDQTGPAGLMTGAKTRAVVSVKVLVE